MNLFRPISVAGIVLLLVFNRASAQQTDSTAVADSLLMLQLQKATQPLPSSAQQQPSAVPRSSISMNPDISAIGDFRSSYTSIGPRQLDLYVNALELQLSSVVDPYARANFIYTFAKDPVSGELTPELEIATLTSLSLPYQLQLTLGKFKSVFGKVNLIHPHTSSFINFPKMTENYFDSEGMYQEGASLSWLVPNPYDIFQELTVEVGRIGSEPNASLARGENNQLSYVGHLKNFFDLGTNSTLELGLSGLTGPNRFEFSTSIGGLDLTYKWKPVQFNTLQSFTWQSEILFSSMRLSDALRVQSRGAYSFAEYQFSQRWFIGARFDYSEFPDDSSKRDIAGAGLLRFQPTEFQVLALEYQYTDRSYDRNTHQVIFRIIFGIGSHAAHQY